MINSMKRAGWQGSISKRKIERGSGFTIMELMIATAVFSVVLLTALAGFLQIGHLFYKGVSTTQTGAAAQQIFSDIAGNFHDSNNISQVQSANGYTYYCLGSSRYTFNIGKEVRTSDSPNHKSPASGGNYGLLKDELPGSNGCATPCDDINLAVPCAAGTVRFNKPVELLGDQMRLSAFSIQPNVAVSPNFYSISIVVAYGDDDLLNNATNSSAACKDDSDGRQYCSVTALNTGIYRGTQ